MGASCAAQSPLRNHHSAYLAMHADDAVQWRLWDDEVVAEAEREQKLIFISSGYFACHWCHVMQRESFQHEVIAVLLNTRFIPVKVDRELNPELDAHLFEFVEKSRGVAGWPLNVFLTPQGHPLTGSGYLKADEFLALIKDLQVRWENEGEGLARLAAEASRELAGQPSVAGTLPRNEQIDEMRRRLFDTLFSKADLLEGGIGEGKKLPHAPLLRALMSLPAERELSDYLQLTLGAIAGNGLHDHLGGGFFRYTVDPAWQQPHFEKMLYDNAQLAGLYLDAAQRWPAGPWMETGRKTLDALLRDFAHPDGGYITSLSALDGEGTEGGYYLWQEERIEALLPVAEWRIFRMTWRLQGGDEWSGELPIQVTGATGLATTLRMPLSQANQWLENIRQRLWQERNLRTLPRDEKRLAGWNGLLLSALARGSRLEGDAQYGQAGRGLRDYLFSLWDGEWLLRMQEGEDVQQRAGLEDYAYVAQGLLDWAEVTGDGEAKKLAARLVGEAYYRFYRDGHWYVEGGGATVVPTRRLMRDGALPSPTAVLAALGRRFGAASPLIPAQINAILFADPQQVMARPLDYPGTIAEIQQLKKRGSRLSLE
ncbi:MAG: DUF255 domain-containing protein [Chromatiales bacterium]|nr:DUF255 domain-containing protein [Chromatiales bacterium]